MKVDAAWLVREIRRQKDEVDFLLAAIVAANGGELRLSNQDFHKADELEWVVETDMAHDGMLFRTQPK